MRSMINMLLITVPLVLGAMVPASAKITQYECKFDQNRARGGGWITELVYVIEDDTTGEILAYDGVIHTFVGNPIPARLASETKARKTFAWEVEVDHKGQSPTIFYTLSYFSNGQSAKMRAQPGGYDNKWTEEGTCTVSVK